MRFQLAALLLSSIPVLAHHSISGAYFTEQQVRVEGTLVEFNYRNPHAFLELQGKDPRSGMDTRYSIEWASVKRLERAGIARDALKPGDHLVVLGNPARKNGDRTLHMVGVRRKADGWKWGRGVE